MTGLAILLLAFGQPHFVCYNTSPARFDDEWHRALYAEMSWRQMRLFWHWHGGPDKPLMSGKNACYDLNGDGHLDLLDVAAFSNGRA